MMGITGTWILWPDLALTRNSPMVRLYFAPLAPGLREVSPCPRCSSLNVTLPYSQD